MDKPKRKLARRMRRAPTAMERALWDLLRDRRLAGLKFRRQVPIGRYVVDFLCFRHRLIVEADGPFHDDDAARDAWLRMQDFRVLRFRNADIEGDRETVVEIIRAATFRDHLSGPLAHPLLNPSPASGEG